MTRADRTRDFSLFPFVLHVCHAIFQQLQITSSGANLSSGRDCRQVDVRGLAVLIPGMYGLFLINWTNLHSGRLCDSESELMLTALFERGRLESQLRILPNSEGGRRNTYASETHDRPAPRPGSCLDCSSNRPSYTMTSSLR